VSDYAAPPVLFRPEVDLGSEIGSARLFAAARHG
jgi:hypothetical protein